MGEPAEVLTFYELPLSGVIPKSFSFSESIAVAEKVIVGDRKATEAGYPPMQNPTAEELQEAVEKAKKESNDVAPADRAYDEAEEAVEALRGKAAELIYDLIAELKFNLRKKDPASQRRIIRSYGIEIISNSTSPEVLEEDIEDFTE